MEKHRHDVVYYAVVDLTVQGDVVGAVDVWRCRVCKTLFCEDKRWGLTELAPEIGFPELEPGAKWAVLLCRKGAEVVWTLLGVKPGQRILQPCQQEGASPLLVTEHFAVRPEEPLDLRRTYGLILIEEHLNKVVEIGEAPAPQT